MFSGSVMEMPPRQGAPSGAFLQLDKPVKMADQSEVRMVQLPGHFSSRVGSRAMVRGNLDKRTAQPQNGEPITYYALKQFDDLTNKPQRLSGSVMRIADAPGYPAGSFLQLDQPLTLNGQKYDKVQLDPTYANQAGDQMAVEGVVRHKTSPNGTPYLMLETAD